MPGGIRVKLALALLGDRRRCPPRRLRDRHPVARAPPRGGEARPEAVGRRDARDHATPNLDGADRLDMTDFVDSAAFVSNSRVASSPSVGCPAGGSSALGDSSAGRDVEITKDPTALDAAESVRTVRGRGQPRRAARTRRSPYRCLRRQRDAPLRLALATSSRRLRSSSGGCCTRPSWRSLIAVGSGSSVAAIHARRLGRLQSGRRPHRRGRIRRAGRRSRQRRGRPARCLVRPHADPARAARSGTEGVRRQCLARAAHAAVLSGGLPRAARRRGPRRGHPPRVPRDDPEPGRPARRSSRPICSTSPAWTRAGSVSSTRRSGWQRTARVVAEDVFALADASGHTLMSSVDDDAWALRRRGARAADRARPRRQRAPAHAARDDGAAAASSGAATGVASRSRTTGPGSRPSTLERIFQRFYRVEGARRRAAVSGSRLPASSRAAWAGR